MYRDILGWDDRAVAQLIEQDRIDILVAVAGHTRNHRLTILAHKPAPIQVARPTASKIRSAARAAP